MIKILKKIESKAYRASERIIALSDGMKNEIQKIENKKDKIVVITNLCDTLKILTSIMTMVKNLEMIFLALKMSLSSCMLALLGG